MVAAQLQAREPKGSAPWAVFDRQLLERALQEHHLPESLAEFITEEHHSVIRSLMDELLGIIPPPWEIVPKIAETVLHLAVAGHVVLVGHGASYITARLPRVFRVRLIGPLPRRTESLQAARNLTSEQAAEAIAKEDHSRARFVKANFNVDVDYSQLYHLVLNTDALADPDAAQVITEAAWRFFKASAASTRS
jgi:hypothetical protein